MSLTLTQRNNTKKELQQNLALTGLSKEQVASDLNISVTKLDEILNLQVNSINNPWIVRNYLLKKVKEAGNVPIPFTALKGDYHKYWFLNGDVIDRGIIED